MLKPIETNLASAHGVSADLSTWNPFHV